MKVTRALRVLTLIALTALLGLSGPSQAQPRHYQPDLAGQQTTHLTLHPMDELDFWTKAKVFEYRRLRVLEYPKLAAAFFPSPKTYQPAQSVFGQIEDGKPWWGILGLNYYGKGKQSIEGPSEETRFLGNPYLVAGVIERWAYHPRPLPAKLVPYFPRVRNAFWSQGTRRFVSRWDVGSYLKTADSLKLERQYTEQLTVVLYNARDLGYSFAQLPQDRTHNVTVEEQSSPFEIPQMLHAGPSAGYPGRANNMSPSLAKLDIKISALPGRFDVNLWRTKPGPGQPPDLQCTILLE